MHRMQDSSFELALVGYYILAASLFAVEDEEKVQKLFIRAWELGWSPACYGRDDDSRPSSIMRSIIGGYQAVTIMQPACFVDALVRDGAHLSIGEFVQARGAGFAVLLMDAHPCPAARCCFF